jgi:hypothetical protein
MRAPDTGERARRQRAARLRQRAVARKCARAGRPPFASTTVLRRCPQRRGSLTPRELEIVKLIAEAYSSRGDRRWQPSVWLPSADAIEREQAPRRLDERLLVQGRDPPPQGGPCGTFGAGDDFGTPRSRAPGRLHSLATQITLDNN